MAQNPESPAVAGATAALASNDQAQLSAALADVEADLVKWPGDPALVDAKAQLEQALAAPPVPGPGGTQPLAVAPPEGMPEGSPGEEATESTADEAKEDTPENRQAAAEEAVAGRDPAVAGFPAPTPPSEPVAGVPSPEPVAAVPPAEAPVVVVAPAVVEAAPAAPTEVPAGHEKFVTTRTVIFGHATGEAVELEAGSVIAFEEGSAESAGLLASGAIVPHADAVAADAAANNAKRAELKAQIEALQAQLDALPAES